MEELLNGLKNKQLQELLRISNAPISGTKAVLVERLMSIDPTLFQGAARNLASHGITTSDTLVDCKDCGGVECNVLTFDGNWCFKCIQKVADPFYIPSLTKVVLLESGLQKNDVQLRRHPLRVSCIRVGDGVQRFSWPKLFNGELDGRTIVKIERKTPPTPSRRCVPIEISGTGTLTFTFDIPLGESFLFAVESGGQHSPKEVPQESNESALQRIERSFGEFIECQTVTLLDPLSRKRIATPAVFDELQPFDLASFLEIARKTLKFQDPHTGKFGTFAGIKKDAFMNHVMHCLDQYPHITEIEVHADGSWKPKGSATFFKAFEHADLSCIEISKNDDVDDDEIFCI